MTNLQIILLSVYLLGFFLVPILYVWLNKKFKDSMYDRYDSGDFEIGMVCCSFFWPISLIYMYFLLLTYWRKN